MVETEILIVGGGPAGIISAITAAKQGREVILVDSKSYQEIGNKVCGDALNLEPIKFLERNLGIPHPTGNEVADFVERAIFKSHNVSFPLSGDGYVLNRHPYGQRLLKMAEGLGVEIKDNTKVISALYDDFSVRGAVVVEKGGEGILSEIHAKITIDCSGRNFIIRKTLPERLFPFLEKHLEKRDIAATYREIISLKNQDHPYHNELYLIYDETIPEPGYFWIFSKGEKQLNVGIGWYMDRKSDRGMKELFREVLNKYYPEGTYEVLDKGGGQIPTRYPLTNAIVPGFLTAGDAALHVNPFTAEGHGPALIAGYYAGEIASKAIEIDKYHSEEFLWQYNNKIMNHFGLSHIKIQLFSEALKKIKVSGLEFLIRRSILSKDQFINIHSGKKLGLFEMVKIAIKAFPRYDILLTIARVSKSTQKFEKIFSNYPNDPENYPTWKNDFDIEMNKFRDTYE
ncbi:NAD(P)/FAD-dependent oxidoreductase [Candidatus Hodarchaeum mangrovi]